MKIDFILLKYVFTINKMMNISYIPNLKIYFKIKQAVLDHKFQTYYVFSEDSSFDNEYLITDLAKYIEEFEVDVSLLTYQDIQLFLMNKY